MEYKYMWKRKKSGTTWYFDNLRKMAEVKKWLSDIWVKNHNEVINTIRRLNNFDKRSLNLKTYLMKSYLSQGGTKNVFFSKPNSETIFVVVTVYID